MDKEHYTDDFWSGCDFTDEDTPYKGDDNETDVPFEYYNGEFDRLFEEHQKNDGNF